MKRHGGFRGEVGRAGLVAVLLGLCVAAAAGQSTTTQPAPAEEPEAEPKPAYNLMTAKAVSGDWFGLRTDLEEAGFSFRLTYQQQLMVNMKGGRDTENGHDFAGSYDMTLLFNLERMFKLPGAEVFIRGKGRYGGRVGDFDEDKIGGLFRTNSDVGETSAAYVDKWHYRQRLLDDRLEFRLGRLYSGDLFDVSTYAVSSDTQFLNAAMVGNQTIPHKNGLGMSVQVWPVDWLYMTAAAIDEQGRWQTWGFERAFHDECWYRAFWEVGLRPKIDTAKGRLHSNIRLGGWYRPGARRIYRDTIDGALAEDYRGDDAGFYFGLDQMIYKELDDPKDRQGLGVFARYGYAPGDINFIEHYWQVGCQYEGLIPTRDQDVIGFGVAQGIISQQYRREIDDNFDRETVYELYYSFVVAPWLVVTPDIQYINQPGGRQTDRDAVVAGIRLRFNL